MLIDEDSTSVPDEEIHSQLEKYLIDEYLTSKGYSRTSLKNLSESEAHRVLNAASTYASGKLAEIENRSHFIHDVDDVGRHIQS